MMRNIEVVPHDPEWVKRFEEERELLLSIFDGCVESIHHIGSTAIIGIPAKPVIDILIVVHEIGSVDRLDPRMIEAGYTPKGEFGIPGRRYFPKGTDEHRTHHVHVFQTGSPDVDRHIAFRDYMNTHKEEAEQYGRLKMELARRFPVDIQGYMDGKDAFIKDLQRRAMEAGGD